MEIIEQIGSYAGLAAVIGLAVLSALYFSQARDVRRLREWAGRAPERTGEPAVAQPQRVVAQPAPAKPPAATGQPTAPAAKPAPAAGAAPAGAAAAAAAAGAAPATVSGPAAPSSTAATPAGARAAEREGASEDTMVHPPPGSNGDGDDEARDEEAAVSEDEDDDLEHEDEHFAEAEQDEFDEDEEEAGVDDEDEFDDRDEADFEDEEEDRHEDEHDEDEHDDGDEYDEDTDDRPAVAAPNLPPSRPLTAAGARRPVPPPALPARTPPPARSGATGPILPPYSQSRPGGQPDSSAQEPSGRRTAIMAIVGGLLLLVGVGFGAMQLLGEDDGGTPAADQSAQQQGSANGGEPGDGGDGGGGRAAVNPGSVTVAVLNGTTVPGLAAQIGDKIEGQGFELGTITNSTDQQRAESVVLYAPGAEGEARDVARRLKISQREAADPDSQGLAGDATVIVVAGQDQTQ